MQQKSLFLKPRRQCGTASAICQITPGAKIRGTTYQWVRGQINAKKHENIDRGIVVEVTIP